MSRENIRLLKPLCQEDYSLSPHDMLDCLYGCADITEMKEARLVPRNMMRVVRLPSKVRCVATKPLREAKDVLQRHVVARIVKSKLLD